MPRTRADRAETAVRRRRGPATARAARRSAADERSRPLYDAIVIGGGHNGLVNGAYLAKAGLKTLILSVAISWVAPRSPRSSGRASGSRRSRTRSACSGPTSSTTSS